MRLPWLWFLVVVLISCREPVGNEQLPNVVFIMADDIGQGDIGFYHKERTGNDPVIPTPNLDELVRTGMRFDDAHTPSALCSPTRYAVMTGNYPFRCYRPWGVWSATSKSGIEEGQMTVGNIMQNAGYKTAFFGKWHLGGDWLVKGTEEIYRGVGTGDSTTDWTKNIGGSPNHVGFDYSSMIPSGIQNNPFAFYENATWMPLGKDSEFIVNMALHGGFYERTHPRFADSNWVTSEAGPRLSGKAVEFISEHAVNTPDQPFFIYYCSQAVHVPHDPPDSFDGKPVKGTTPSAHGDMVSELDLQVGAIVEALKASGQYDNTLIIFSSDNGGLEIKESIEAGHDSSNGYRGSKTWIYEGGHRVPLIASWPGKIEPNSVSDEPIMVQDLAATLLAITSQDVPQDQFADSYNILPLLMQQDEAKGREILLMQGSGGRANLAIRKGDWKLIIKSDRNDASIRVPIELYNLKENVLEEASGNLINHPEQQGRVAELLGLFDGIRDSKNAFQQNQSDHE